MGKGINQKPEIFFTKRELSVMADQEFLLMKKQLLEKIRHLLSKTQLLVRKRLHEEELHSPLAEIKFAAPKISKGEHYRNFPYLVLDYPTCLTKKDIFAFRTMFWWGHHFSVTLHLQGRYLHMFRHLFVKSFRQLCSEEIFIGVGKTPWEYHYGTDNYKILTGQDLQIMEKWPFLKLSKRFDLNSWEQFPGEVVAFFASMLQVLNDNSSADK